MQYKWTALTVTTVGVLMSGVEARIVVVGLPTIAHELGGSLGELIWVTQAFVLATTVCVPLIGRITDIVGRIKIYNIGFIIFTIGSALCSISFSPLELIASRIVQGAGSAMLITNSAAILTDATPKNELGTFLGINQIAFRAGAVAGLTLSGVILSVTDWRALFYINIPIGIFGTIWSHVRLKEIATTDPVKQMDWIGFGTFSSALALILLALTFLSFGLSERIFGFELLVTGFLLLVAFIFVELKVEAPLLDLKLFKIRQFAAGNIAQALNSLAFSGIILMLSFYLQIMRGETALSAGISIIPLDISFLLLGPLSGRLSDKYGSRVLASCGLGLVTAGFLLMSTFSASTTYTDIAASLCLIGGGAGMFASPNISSVMGSVPAHRRGVASGFRSTTFNAASTASYGLVILLMTTAIPYSTFSSLLQGSALSILLPAAKEQFSQGFRFAVFSLALINGAGIFASVLRGEKTKFQENKSEVE